ncbi:BMP family lipoprotein [Pseudoflavonifractor phocaeensis]|uniref:BMP family lipoprotein n=1 Tax=Pseudoflavonifractor phocaeensis TaxID=1870988 RepID=UPI00210C51C1|nr:BMP family ABC transporter substrate-binding protein [Pseudoflavonifractor phocaeensis]MCQ4865311.1 BMP family ABC transporter substrate-binding protein [Pseudoflavonifractor phocaeensis]
MNKKLVAVILMLTMLMGALAGCGDKGDGKPSASGDGAAEENISIALCVTGTLGDKALADTTWAGLQRIEEEYDNVTCKVFEAPEGATDWEPNLVAASTGGYDLVIVTASSMGAILKDVAGRFPDVTYVSIDSPIDLPNVASCTFCCNEASFLLGCIAGLWTTRTEIPGVNGEKIVGWISGMQAPINDDYYIGFCAGVEYTCPDATVLQSWTGTYSDPLMAKEMTKALISQGADIISPVLSSAAVGAHEACREQGVYSFALDTNQDAVYPGTVITTALKDGSVVTYNYAKEFIEGTFSTDFRLLNLSMGAMDITDMVEIEVALGDEFPADIKETVMELRQQIIDGELEVPYNPVVRGEAAAK